MRHIRKHDEELNERRAQTQKKPIFDGRSPSQGKEEQKAPDSSPDDPLIKPGKGEKGGEFHAQQIGEVVLPAKPHDQTVYQPTEATGTKGMAELRKKRSHGFSSIGVKART